MSKIDIIYWSDFACPFCYIGERNLKHAMKKLGAEDRFRLRMKSYELHPDAPTLIEGDTATLIARKYGMSIEQAREAIQRIEKMGSLAGIRFDYANAKYSNTFDAHRLTKMVQSADDEAAEDRWIETVFSALFEKNEQISDQETLVRLAKTAGFDSDRVRAVLSTDAYTTQVRWDEKQADELNIHGVPYFVLDKRYVVPGTMPEDEMVKLLKEILTEHAPNSPDADSKEISDSVACGPDGCC